MSDARMAIVNNVFSSLVTNSQGHVPVDFAARRFDGTNHPLVVHRGLLPEEALYHFMEYLEYNGQMPVNVTHEVFYNYFADFSAAVDDDQYFEAVLMSLW